MVVHDFYVNGIVIHPDKTDAPLVVDPDAVLSFPVSRQRFQSVRRWNTQAVY
jgi:hypothetical protein